MKIIYNISRDEIINYNKYIKKNERLSINELISNYALIIYTAIVSLPAIFCVFNKIFKYSDVKSILGSSIVAVVYLIIFPKVYRYVEYTKYISQIKAYYNKSNYELSVEIDNKKIIQNGLDKELIYNFKAIKNIMQISRYIVIQPELYIYPPIIIPTYIFKNEQERKEFLLMFEDIKGVS